MTGVVAKGRGVAAIALVLALLGLPASAAAGRPVRPEATLDPAFGHGGLVLVHSRPSFSALGALGPGGDLVVTGGVVIDALNDAGRPSGIFGGGGRVTTGTAPGEDFKLGGFTVDVQGRLLVAGISLFPESENPSPTAGNLAPLFRPAEVRLLRFLPGGALDPSFGQGGVVETDLGLPAPSSEDGELGTHPALTVTGVAVDPQGRVIVTGSAVTRLAESCGGGVDGPVPVLAGFVVRLLEGGEVDPGFAGDGLLGGRDLSENALGAETIGDPVVGESGAIVYRSLGAYLCEPDRSHLGIARLTADGSSDTAFGEAGAVFGPYGDLAAGPGGSLVVLQGLSHHEKERVRARVVRLTEEGRRDHSFGHGGQSTVSLGPAFATTLDSLAVDRQGRILIGGTLEGTEGRSMVLLRLAASGRQERRFGPRGRVATPVAGLLRFGESDLLLDRKGRAVVVHPFERHGTSGLVVARYLLAW